MKRITMLFGAGLLLLCSMLYAAVPQLINFQGVLRNGSGNPVANGSYSVTFTIYDAPSAGNALWTETQSVNTVNGLFTILLGSSTPVLDSTFNDSTRWLGIQVGADPEMTPRQRLSSVGYSYNSSEWTSAAQDLFRLNGNVGIGTTGPNTKLTVWTPSVAGVQEGIRINNPVGFAGSGNGSSLVFSQDRDPTENYINAIIEGVQEGENTSLNGYLAFSTKFNAVVGERMRIASTGNVGIGTTPSIFDTRLIVQDNGASGAAAVWGHCLATNGKGVIGQADYGATAYGIWGISSAGYAGYFGGKVHVQGTLSKSAGSFQIDHPLDPANKYLYHSFVESPDMMNIYNGNVTLDSKGEAVIALPDWFGALNKDFRYQLTCIGGFAQVYVAEKVKNNRFKIAGGTAGLEVSWQVTGIRQDAYANAHRIPVEELKSNKEQGYYLHPELFGQPEEKSTEWARHPEIMKEMKEMREKAKADK